jgi:hypothetical protein
MKPKRKQKRLSAAKSDQPLKQHSNQPKCTGENKFDPLLALVGSGRDLWADEHADEYVNRLREDWE